MAAEVWVWVMIERIYLSVPPSAIVLNEVEQAAIHRPCSSLAEDQVYPPGVSINQPAGSRSARCPHESTLCIPYARTFFTPVLTLHRITSRPA